MDEIIEIKREEIIETIKGIEDMWILGVIHKFITGMIKEGD